MLRQITDKEIQRMTHVYCRVYLKYFSHSQMQDLTCSTDYRVYKLIAALRSAMMIFFTSFR